MSKLLLKADKREIVGRKVKKLRKDGILPANIFGKKVNSEAVQVAANDFMKVYKDAGETGLVELTVGNAKKPALIHNVQVDPVTDVVLHVDFLQVDLKEKVTAQVPVEITGESPAEKQSIGTVVQYVDEIEVEALPGDLPDKFEIDASKLTEVDQSVFVKDLPVDTAKIEIKEDADQIVVKVEPPKKEEEVAQPAEGEEAAVEGEPTAEGQAETPKSENTGETTEPEGKSEA